MLVISARSKAPGRPPDRFPKAELNMAYTACGMSVSRATPHIVVLRFFLYYKK
jgi:hypothetical protein